MVPVDDAVNFTNFVDTDPTTSLEDSVYPLSLQVVPVYSGNATTKRPRVLGAGTFEAFSLVQNDTTTDLSSRCAFFRRVA